MRLLMRAIQLPHKMHCTVRSTPPHFVVNAMNNIVQSVLTHTLVGTKLFIRHNTCHMFSESGIHSFGLVLCDVCFVGKGLALILVFLGEDEPGTAVGLVGTKQHARRADDRGLAVVYGSATVAPSAASRLECSSGKQLQYTKYSS